MEDFHCVYDTNQDEKNSFRYYFVSKGKRDIEKAVQFTYINDINNSPFYNLGFGDYDKENDTIYDKPISCNDDHYKVFHTILSTIPKLFETCRNAMLHVKGSDSSPEFMKNCKESCSRNCKQGECKKAHRRINIYRSFVDKHFDKLSKDYLFYGRGPTPIERYQKGKKYTTVVLKKKDLN